MDPHHRSIAAGLAEVAGDRAGVEVLRVRTTAREQLAEVADIAGDSVQVLITDWLGDQSN